jgi:ABC-type transporter Mla MlaB component
MRARHGKPCLNDTVTTLVLGFIEKEIMDLRLRMKPHPATPGVLHEAVVVEVGGEIDLHSAPRLREELGRALESNTPPRVIIDLAGVSFIDSTGIGVLVGALKRAREAKGELRVL